MTATSPEPVCPAPVHPCPLLPREHVRPYTSRHYDSNVGIFRKRFLQRNSTVSEAKAPHRFWSIDAFFLSVENVFLCRVSSRILTDNFRRNSPPKAGRLRNFAGDNSAILKFFQKTCITLTAWPIGTYVQNADIWPCEISTWLRNFDSTGRRSDGGDARTKTTSQRPWHLGPLGTAPHPKLPDARKP